MVTLIFGVCLIIIGFAFAINPLKNVKSEKIKNMTPEEATKKYRLIGIAIIVLGILVLII